MGGRPRRLHKDRHVAAAGLEEPQHVVEARVGLELWGRAHFEVAHARGRLLVHQNQLLGQDDANQLLPEDHSKSRKPGSQIQRTSRKRTYALMEDRA